MSDLFHNSIWFIPASVFIGGLIGSPHCLAMCGPLVFNFAKFPRRLLAYQLGRMSAYTTAGFVAGTFGRAVLGTQSPFWISTFALVTISVLLIFNGYRAVTNRPLHFALPKRLETLSSKVWRGLSSKKIPKAAGALFAGIMTVFLPCGHLYGFLLGAVATGSGAAGAIFMFAFWLGSTPLLAFGAQWFHRFLATRSLNGQRWAGVLLVVAGLFSLSSFALRLNTVEVSHASSHVHEIAAPAPRCH